jgi:hypothetical protein
MKRIALGLFVLAVAVAVGTWRCKSRDVKAPGAPGAQGQTARETAAARARADKPPPAWFVARNAPARKIAGQVTRGGAPVSGAVVTLTSLLTRAGALQPIEVKSGADGRFDLGSQPAASYEVSAAAPGATPALVRIDLADPTLKPPSDQLVLRLGDCTASVSGTVYDAAGNPLPRVRVLHDGLVGVETDARGAYKLCVPFGDIPIEYGADGFGTVLLHIDARGEVERDVVLVPDAEVVVRAVRADDGRAVPEAHVFVFPVEWGPDRAAQRTGLTGPDGTARVSGLLPGRYRVNGFAEGLQAPAGIEVVAEVGAANEAVLRLDPSVRITGKVMNGEQPVAGARVVAIRKSPVTWSMIGTSQVDGSFTLERVPVGELAFQAPPYEVSSPAVVKAEAGKNIDDVVLQVRALGTIRGTVTRLGKPVANVDVCCVPALRPPMTSSDVRGTYELVGVPPGTYSLGAGSDEIGAFTLGTKVTLAAGEERVVDLELDQAGMITGTVVDRAGKPVKGVFVRWIHEKTGDVGRSTTDAQGRYRCGAMTGGGKYRAAVFPSATQQQVPYPTADGAPYPALDVKDGKTLIEGVKLAIDKPQLAISGTVTDDAGTPVVDAIVKAMPAIGDEPPVFQSWRRLPMTSTDGEGRFTIRDLPPGKHAIQARGVDGAEGTTPPVSAGSTGVEVRMERPGTIVGKLAGFTQTPVVYARTLVGFRQIAGDVDGQTFRVSGLRPGRYLVNAMTTYEGDAQVVEVRAGQRTPITLTSKGKATIDATVLDFRTRAPIADVACHVVMAVDGEQSETNWDPRAAPKSDTRGRLTLDPAPAGNVSVSCMPSSFRRSPPSTDLVLTAGARASAQLLTVELTQENPSTIGVELNWRVTPPRISAVRPGTPAARAGILIGDLVTAVDGASVQGLNSAGVQLLIEDTPAGNEVRITVQRGTATKSFAVKAQSDDL